MKITAYLRPLLVAIIAASALSSCSYHITRTGYQLPTEEKSDTSCKVVFKKHLQEAQGLERIGQINLTSTGFTTACSERTALELLYEEACRLNADIVNIYKEERPNFMTSCYQCQAEFFVIEDKRVNYETDEDFSQEILRKRKRRDNATIIFSTVAHFAIGFAIGYFLIAPR